jgi:hypothetical protein
MVPRVRYIYQSNVYKGLAALRDLALELLGQDPARLSHP